jgi:Xaa-Pro aminopeptidase
MSELETILSQIQALLSERQLEALLLRRVSSFAWATGGAAAYVNTASTEATASLLITPHGRYVITNNIEAPRLEHEEQLAAQGWQFQVSAWHAPGDAIAELAAGFKLGADSPYPGATDLSDEIASLRSQLTPEAGERLRAVGQLCAEAMYGAVREVRPGQTEHQIAGRLALEAESRGVQAIVNLVATDERIYNFRHPLPTGKQLDRYALLVLCGRRHGLVCSVTRCVHFGRLPDELRDKAEAVARIDATLIEATRPGATLGEIFERGITAYAQVGFPDEWTRHHQGGPAGYEPRELLATPGSPARVTADQAYAWNPSISGAKSEDTILVTAGAASGNEVLTAIPDWPSLTVTLDDGHTLERPAILELP